MRLCNAKDNFYRVNSELGRSQPVGKSGKNSNRFVLLVCSFIDIYNKGHTNSLCNKPFGAVHSCPFLLNTHEKIIFEDLLGLWGQLEALHLQCVFVRRELEDPL